MAKPKLLRCEQCGALVQAEPAAEITRCSYCGHEAAVPGQPTELDIFVNQFERDNLRSELTPEEREAVGWLKNSGRAHKLIGGQHFYLEEEGITDEEMRFIGKCCFVTELHLGINPISNIGLERIAGLTELEELELNNTGITDDGLVYLSGMGKLEMLNLEDTDVGDPGIRHLLGLESLQQVNLNGTAVTEQGSINLAELPQIESIEIQEDKIQTIELLRKGLYEKFYNGFGINLSGQGVTDDDLQFLKKFSGVSVLNLNKNNIEGPGLVHLEGMKNLLSLSLDDNPLCDPGLVHLQGLKKLKTISMYDTKVTRKGAKPLERGIRKKSVFYDEMFS